MVTINDSEWVKINDTKELKKIALIYAKQHFSGATVVNTEKQISVKISTTGVNHVLYARKVAYHKVIAVKYIPEIIKQGQFVNWGNPSKEDPENVIGFMRFKCLLKINGQKYKLNYDIRIDKTGNFYYDHNIRIKKED